MRINSNVTLTVTDCLFTNNSTAANAGVGQLNGNATAGRVNAVFTNWTWVNGSNTTGAFGNYGAQGTPAAANVPGSRRDATGWAAADGSLWHFGGLGLPVSGAAGDLDDLWRFNRGTGQWTWMKGSSVIATAAVYGVQGTPAAANTPGGRSAGSGWSTVDGTQSLSTAPSVSAGASSAGGSFKLDLNHVRPGVSYHLETSTLLP